MIKTKTTYSLIKGDIPIIKGKRIVSDVRVGGEKLVYKRVSYPIRVWKIFNLLTVHIPLVLCRKKNGKIGLDINISTVAFLRPYKKNWAKKKEKEPFHLWGKKEHPLTNIWVELEYDYEDNIKSTPLIKARIEDHKLIKFLRQHDQKFTLIN